MEALVTGFPSTHLAVAKWAHALDPVLERVEEAVHEVDRAAPIHLLRFPEDGGERFIESGRVSLSFTPLPAAVDWIRVGNTCPRPSKA